MASEQPKKSEESATDTADDSKNGEPRTSDDAPSTQSSAFQAAIGAWRSIDLSSLQKSLDTTASEIVNGQRDSLVERKELAQKTKEYRKLDEEAKKEEWKGLLKSYQTFIDHLTTSKKATETSFLSLYSTISEAPDPYPLLEATIDSLVNFSEMQSMIKENASYKATINRLNSQIENLEGSMNFKNKELERKDREKEEEAAKVEEVWRGVLDEKTRNWEGKEKALTEKLEHQENVLKEMKASFEVAQKMGGSNSAMGDDFLGKERSAEMEIVTRDLERTTLRLAEVEARNEQLRLDLEKASSPEHTAQQVQSQKNAEAEDESTILRLQHESSNLLRKIDNAKAETEMQKKEYERKLRTLERNINGLEKNNKDLRDKVTKCSDYEDVRRELEILKSIEFATGEDDDEEPAPADPENENKKETLEQLLLSRNKKLGSELTLLRVSHQDLTHQLHSLQRTLDSTTADLTAARALNEKLEDDLFRFQDATSSAPQFSSALSVAGTYVSRYPQSSRGPNRISPTSSIIGGHIPSSSSSTPFDAPPPSAGILPMVTAQRDRFKARNAELESELSRSTATITSLRSEIASLQKDNMNLYEKTRYVSSYSRPNASGAATTSANANTNSGLTIDRYRAAYEANISPFEAFRGRESARAYKRMGLAERMIYSVTRVVLANRLSRNLFAGYCVALHLLVFSMLYWTGTASVQRDIVGMAGDTTAAGLAGGAAAGLRGGTGGGGGGGGGGVIGEVTRPGDWQQQDFDGRL